MMQSVNHFEGHTEISRKHELFKNIKQHLEKIQLQNILSGTVDLKSATDSSTPLLFSVLPLQFHIKVELQAPSANPLNPLAPFSEKQEKILKPQLK